MPIDTSRWDGIQLDSVTPPPEDFEGLDADEAAEAIEEWFAHNFEGPEQSTPRDDGDYVYIWGGPYDTEDIVEDIFRGVAPDEVVDTVIETLNARSGIWVPHERRVQAPDEDDPLPVEQQDVAALHADMLERIAALEDALDQVRRRGIGGNSPPEPFDDEDPLDHGELEALATATAVLKSQEAGPRDVQPEVGNAVETVGATEAKLRNYFAKLGDAYLTKFAESVGTESGKLVTRIPLWLGLFGAVRGVAKVALEWLHAVYPPF